MVELYGIELFVDVVIAQIIVNHHVRADVFAAVPMQNFRLLVHVRFYLLRMGEFAWADVERREGEFDFGLFKRVVDKAQIRKTPERTSIAP